MANYNWIPHTWNDGGEDIINAEKLNNLENGVKVSLDGATVGTQTIKGINGLNDELFFKEGNIKDTADTAKLEIETHSADTTIHVTSTDKTTWNSKQDAITAGTGISKSGNTLSVNDEINKLRMLYKAEGSTDANTLLITYSTSEPVSQPAKVGSLWVVIDN